MKQISAPILAFVLLLLAPVAAFAAPASLKEISAYLNGIRSAETTFSQYNADGTRSGGRLFILRPGRMRFEYAAPDNTLVLASGGQVAIFDNKSNQPPEQYPLSRTPLNLILAAKVDLTRAKMVVGHGESDGFTTVTAQDPDRPEVGTITMFFARNPTRLAKWIVTDEGGGQTRVELGDLRLGASYPPSTFSIEDETVERVGRKDR